MSDDHSSPPQSRPGANRPAKAPPPHVRRVPPAVDILSWGWVLAMVVSANPQQSGPTWVAAVPVAASALAYRLAAELQPMAVAGRGAVWLAGPFLALALLGAAPSPPADVITLSLGGIASATAGLTLAVGPAVASTLVLQVWHGSWLVVVGGAPLGGPLVAEALLVTGASCATAAGVARTIRLGRARVDGVVAGWLADRRILREGHSRDRVRRETRAHLHDTVLTTLTTIGNGWVQDADRVALRQECARVSAALTNEVTGQEDVVDLVDVLRATATGPRFGALTVEITGDGPLPVSRPAADALRFAAAEALTNVLRHSGVREVVVRIETRGDHVGVLVRDRGRGFSGQMSTRLGIRESVAGRMERVGGSGWITSIPGQGTEVNLWAPTMVVDSGPALPSLWSTQAVRSAALWLSGGVLGVGVAMSLVEGSVAVEGAALLLTALALAARGSAARSSLPLTVLAGIACPVVVLLSTSSAHACSELVQPPLGVALGTLAVGLVLALLRPGLEAAAWAAACLLAYLVTAVSVGDPECTEAVATVAALQTAQVAAVIVVVGALQGRAETARALLLAVEVRDDQAQDSAVRDAVHQGLVLVVSAAVQETLAALARGELEPDTAAVRRRCRRDARLVRTLLTQTVDGDEVLADLVTTAVAARSHGMDLAVQGALPPGSLTPATRAEALAVVDGVIVRLRSAGWRGEGEISLVGLEDATVITTVARDAGWVLGLGPADGIVSPAEGTGAEIRVDVIEGTLWVSHRLEVLRRSE